MELTLIIYLVTLLQSQIVSGGGKCWNDKKHSQKVAVTPDKVTKYLSVCLKEEIPFKELLKPLLITRVPGTPGSAAARKYITGILEKLGWTVTLDTFTQDTIIGEQTFSNIIATLHPDSPRRLVLSAHYDSKLTPTGIIAASDSAVPCAMMLDLALKMTSIFQSKKKVPELTLQLIFFDGEEAFKKWTDTDSLYGSRHLAELWEKTPYTVSKETGYCQSGKATELDRIDSFILLDLLGTTDVKIMSNKLYESSLFKSALDVEKKVRQSGCGEMPIIPMMYNIPVPKVEDDHVPFLKRGVKRILHMISTPFPSVWHKMEDNESALDYPTIDYINKILRVYVYGYFNIRPTNLNDRILNCEKMEKECKEPKRSLDTMF